MYAARGPKKGLKLPRQVERRRRAGNAVGGGSPIEWRLREGGYLHRWLVRDARQQIELLLPHPFFPAMKQHPLRDELSFHIQSLRCCTIYAAEESKMELELPRQLERRSRRSGGNANAVGGHTAQELPCAATSMWPTNCKFVQYSCCLCAKLPEYIPGKPHQATSR